jgi:prepilin-type processing-associated H-X9-DG protein
MSLLELIVCLGILAGLVGLVLSAVQRVRSTAAQSTCQDRLRQLALAAHNYQTVHGSFPPGSTTAKPYPYMSWCARLLPYLEQTALWERTEAAYQEEPNFLKPLHRPLLRTSLSVFLCPTDPRTDPKGPGLTSYQGNAGTNYLTHDGALYTNSSIRLSEVTDGSSNTLLLGERPASADREFGWWYAGWGQSKDGSLDATLGVNELNAGYRGGNRQCPPGPYAFAPGSMTNQCDVFHYWSLHPSAGANFGLCDGSVRLIRYSASDVMPALATRAAGDVAGPTE